MGHNRTFKSALKVANFSLLKQTHEEYNKIITYVETSKHVISHSVERMWRVSAVFFVNLAHLKVVPSLKYDSLYFRFVGKAQPDRALMSQAGGGQH